MLKAIYVDYHGVLDRRSYDGLQYAIAQNSGQPDVHAVLRQFTSDIEAYAAGDLAPHDFWRMIEERYGASASRAGREYFLHVEPVLPMWNLLSALKPEYDLGLFTDCPRDKKDVIRSAYALTDYFDQLLFSCDAGSSKRNADFYQLMLQSGTWAAGECLLVDASEENCTQALNAGFQAHLFRDVPDLESYLQRL